MSIWKLTASLAARVIVTHFGLSSRERYYQKRTADQINWPTSRCSRHQALISIHVYRKPPAGWASDHLPITAKITTAFCARD
jgi:hypothetical protein